MRRSLWGFVVVPAILIIAGAMAWRSTTSPARVPIPMSDGAELRVLKVSLGTNHVLSYENIWKRNLRRVLPRAWQAHLGPFQGEHYRTRHDSLVVWVVEAVRSGGRDGLGTFDDPGAVFADGTVAKGQIRRARGGIVGLQFDCFRRDSREITLQVRKGGMVRFVVINPQLARAANWIAEPLPQTNQSSRTEVVLRQLRQRSRIGEIEALVRGRALGDGKTGWMAWRVTAIDSWGNWAEGRWAYHRLPSVPLLPLPDSTWKLIVEGQEYLSAGHVPHPTNGMCLILSPTRRAEELGARFLMLAGRGTYRIVNGVMADPLENTPGTAGWPSLVFSNSATGTNWFLDLWTPVPGILCLFDYGATAPVLGARLRERVGADDGRVFLSPSVTSVTNFVNGSSRIASFFAPRMPGTTTNLELEVVSTLPPMEFLVSPPER